MPVKEAIEDFRPPSQNRAVFLDRDGTLMAEVNFCADPSKVRAMPGAGECLAKLRRQGWLTIMVTNQSGIGQGLFTVADYEAVNAELFRQLGGAIDATYFCPDHPADATQRRKPGTGMIEEAKRDHKIALEESWLIGDKHSDIVCGRSAGCRTILVMTGYGRNYRDCGAHFVACDIVEAAQLILQETR
jgi:D-glycero-D-manno-heptose 1,7-bisphosphate phosphatase